MGSILRAPMSRSLALEGTFTYLIPGSGKRINFDGQGSESKFTESAWNVSCNLVYYPAGRSRRSLASPYRPLFEVADNGSLQLAPGSCNTSTRGSLFLANQVGKILQMQALGNRQWVIQRSNGMLYANAPTAGGNVPKALQFSLQAVGR